MLRQQPLIEIDGDAFAHVDIADNLSSMIRQSRGETAEGRLASGLLGPFAAGNSTVIELLSGQAIGEMTCLREENC